MMFGKLKKVKDPPKEVQQPQENYVSDVPEEDAMTVFGNTAGNVASSINSALGIRPRDEFYNRTPEQKSPFPVYQEYPAIQTQPAPQQQQQYQNSIMNSVQQQPMPLPRQVRQAPAPAPVQEPEQTVSVNDMVERLISAIDNLDNRINRVESRLFQLGV